ncbi:MAG TPA: LysR substrate-binding domain-containing protein [Alphaproteobacteria bacterium]|nr:LysR substrate-binding domain-containing protein [Alphaproteobacteria bacterium]
MLRHLDLAVLRTFLLIAEGRSFAETAALVGRSPSAVSLQIQKLEDELGAPVLRRSARGVALTLAGERLLGFARRMVALNDEALGAFRAEPPRPLRFGTTQDFAEAALPEVLRRFALEHPAVELTLAVDRSAHLIDAVRGGALDLAIAVGRDDPLNRGALLAAPMVWIGRAGAAEAGRTLPLALFEPPCSFRSAALAALAAAGRPARIAITSPSLSGLRAAVQAGLGITARTRHLLGPGLEDVGPALGLPPLPEIGFCFYAPDDTPWAARDDLAALCRRMLA